MFKKDAKVTCVDNSDYEDEFTAGRVYTVVKDQVEGSRYVKLVTDGGRATELYASRFALYKKDGLLDLAKELVAAAEALEAAQARFNAAVAALN